MAGVTQAEAHVNGDCWPDTCVYCNREPIETCDVCDGTGEVYNTSTRNTETCRTCLGTGTEG